MYSLLERPARAAADHLLLYVISISSSLAAFSGYLSRQCAASAESGGIYPLHSVVDGATARLCRFLATCAAVTSVLAFQRVDTHLHAVPPAYLKALEEAGGDPSGFPTPEWSVDATIQFMDQTNTDIGILSISTPGVPIAGTSQRARALARSINEFFGNITTDDPHAHRLGFFGALPDWRDVNGTLAELDYLFKEQRLGSGVTAYTTYGDRFLGDPLFAPIWHRLQQYEALVMVHPAILDARPPFVVSSLTQPFVDFPLATTRAAADLVISQTLRRCPDVDIILAHAGGAIPFLAERILGGLLMSEVADAVGYNEVEAREDFRRFYYDTAFSTSAAQLHGLLDFADPSHIVFGTDFPYAATVVDNFLLLYSMFVANDDRGAMVGPERLRENSVKLLEKHAVNNTY